MNDFLDCCKAASTTMVNQAAYVPRCDLETARTQRDALKSALADVLRWRDDARLEADRLEGEVARLAKERDEAGGDINQLRADVARLCHERDEAVAALESAAPPRPCQEKAEVARGLKCLELILVRPANGVPGDAENRLARVALIVGELSRIVRP